LPDLLATKAGRLTTFFMLYMTEGIPLGFTATAIATQMRRQGWGRSPSARSWDRCTCPGPSSGSWARSSTRSRPTASGRRRVWIIAMQIGMMATLIFAMPIDYVAQIGLFTAVIFLHNAFGADAGRRDRRARR
jgi:PAT family beta-lactamase induction signal transducer AmpG